MATDWVHIDTAWQIVREVQWWRASALGQLWEEALRENDGEDFF